MVSKRRLLHQPFYSEANIDRVISAGGKLSNGLVTVKWPDHDTYEWVKRRVKRRDALEQALEQVAREYLVDAEIQKRPSDSKLRGQFVAIESAAWLLLKALGIKGKTDPETMPHALREKLRAQAKGRGQQNRRRKVEGRLGDAELKQALESVASLRLWAEGAKARAKEAIEQNRQRQRKHHCGDEALNEWTGKLMGIYGKIYNRPIRTSVGGHGQANEGFGGGPLVRFIQAVLQPVLGQATPNEDAIRARVERLRKTHKSNSKKT